MDKKWFNSRAARYLLTALVSFIGGCLFTWIGMPIPWLLGPMIVVLLASKWAKLPLVWPGSIRDAGILIVGYSLGLSLTKDALIEIVHQLPSMLLMTVSLIAICIGLALLISKLSGIDFATMMTASIPGGLTQIITLAEEFKEIDVTVVTFFQVSRLMMIVFFVPLLLYSPWLTGAHAGTAVEAAHTAAATWAGLFPNIGLYAIVCLLSAWIGKLIKLPTAYMLGPMIGTALLHLSGYQGPQLPASLLNISQFMIGSYVGLLLQPGKLERKLRTISIAICSGVLLVLSSLGLSMLLSLMHPISPATSLLSMAPGGMDQMGIMAHEVGADLSVVSGYQTFRILFIYFVVSSVLKAAFRMAHRRKNDSSSPHTQHE
ncbi:AbrB family transcriptional regulator [Paenibacillus hexagrammi]|uniref:AbrB family transcriptional regulator n=1 Tax=Paenibacillus hexagrammi TaxID=2908839 RepID=A0ABY3SH08_9BACL|nr:AbrB family transcriptional regulator [Paenibacillus sp. YPD9-1]UJF32476.1 AbrB family transcriptional regulator [Paenibacillus sp. YPD9-1]